MALPASDNFNRTNQNPIAGNWTNGYRAGAIDYIQLLSNSVQSANAGADGFAWWNADTFNADHYGECKVIGTDCGPAVRCSLGGCYYWTPYSDGEVWKYYYDTSGHWAKIGEANTTVTSTDVLRIEALGTGATVTIKVYKNGALVATLTDTTSSRLTTGAAGIYCIGTNNVDDWAGGNSGVLAGAATGTGTASGALSSSASIVGATTGTGTASGTLGGSLALAGAATGTAAVEATPTSTAGGAIVGDATGAAVVEATLIGAGALSGSSVGVAAVVATISGGSDLSGAISASAIAAGALSGAGALNGAATGTGTVSGVASGSSTTFDHDVTIGNGYTDVSPRQIVRTSDNRVWAASWDTFDHYPKGTDSGLGQTLRMYKADQTGIPSSFTAIDTANEPVDVNSWSIAVGASDVIHVIWTKRATWGSGAPYLEDGTDNYIYYCQFDTSAGTWGSAETLESAAAITEMGQGDELVSIAVDSSGVPHVAYLKSDGTRRRVNYRNRTGGTWSGATIIDDQSFSGDQRCWHPGIAFDNSGRTVITWIRGTHHSSDDGRIFIRVYDGSWGTTHDVVGADVFVGIDTGTPIYIDSSNRYHLCYITTSATKYAQYRFSDDVGASWTANHPGGGTYIADNPAPAPAANGKIRIYSHGLDADSFPVVYHQGDGGSAAWDTVVTYANTHTPNDCSVNVRWSRYYYLYPSHRDVLYWESDYPTNVMYLGVDVSGTDPLAGAATGTASVTGAAAAAGALVGSATGTAAVAGALSGGNDTSGAVTASAALSGTLTGAGALSGSETSTGTAAGTLAGSGALTGAATGTASVVGSIYGIGSSVLVGAATGTADVVGTLAGAGALAGSVTGTATVSGSTSLDLYAVGDATGTVTVEATLTASGILIGDVYASATCDATLTADGALLGSVTGTATLYGLLIDGAWHASGTRTIYKADARASIEPETRVSIMAED